MKMISKAILVLAAVAVMAVPAMAGDKLIVKDATGVNNVFKVDDLGNISGAGLTYDAVNKRLGVGTSTPPNTMGLVKDITAGGSIMMIDGYGNVNFGPNIAIRTSRGTEAVPAATQNADIVGQLNFRGRGATAWAGSRRAGIVSYATENYTDTAQGTNLTFVTTANGTAIPTEKLFVNGDGKIGIGASPVLSGSGLLDINGDAMRIRTPRTIPTATTACNQGEIAWDASFVYVCVATNSWKRTALTAW